MRAIVKEVLKVEKCPTNQVNIYFVTTEEISRLHQEFFGDPSTTDCITFPIDSPETAPSDHHVLGEVFVCPQTAHTYLLSHPGSVYEETTLYLVHGLLHLLGYDDLEPKARATMRAAEKRLMQHLLAKGLLLS